MTSYLNNLKHIFSKDQLVFDDDLLIHYDSDKSHSVSQKPIAVVYVKTHEEVLSLVTFANEHSIALVSRGSGTGKAGGCVPSNESIVVSFEKMNRIIEIDFVNSVAVVEPGVILNTLKHRCDEVNLMYPPDPASFETCTIGGNVAVNAGGPSCLKYGVTKDYVLGLKGVYGNGESFKFGGKLRKNVAGLDLLSLMVGSEGLLGCITEIIVKLIPKPPTPSTCIKGFDSILTMMTFLEKVRQKSPLPTAIEYFDSFCVDSVTSIFPTMLKGLVFPKGAHYLLLSEEGISEDSVSYGDALWECRRVISKALTLSSKNKVSEDITVPSSAVPDMLMFLESLKRKGVSLLGYGHIGDGNLHVNVLNHSLSADEWASVYPSIIDALMKKTVALGGTITGEHGVGLTKKEFMPLMFSDIDLTVMREIKKVCDPNGILNPGKVF